MHGNKSCLFFFFFRNLFLRVIHPNSKGKETLRDHTQSLRNQTGT